MASGTADANLDRYVAYMPDEETAVTTAFRVPKNAEVDTLITEICNRWKKKKALNDGEEPILIKCGEEGVDPQDTCYARVVEWLRKNSGKNVLRMHPSKDLADYFDSGPAIKEKKIIDIVVVTDSILESRDVLRPLPERSASEIAEGRVSFVENNLRKLPSPSEGVKDERGIQKCNDGMRGIHAHRPAGNYGPPTCLFHPALARLRHYLQRLDLPELEPSAEYLKMCHLLIVYSCKFFASEEEREKNAQELINALVGTRGLWQGWLQGGTAPPDATWGDIVRLILELKNEEGIKGLPILQAVIAFAKILAQPKYQRVVARSNCPVILIGMAGTRMDVSTVVFTDGIYVDKLLSQDLYIDAWQSETVLRVGRIFKAISIVAAELRDFYEALDADTNPAPSTAHFFPDPVPAVEATTLPELRYLGKLSRKGDLIEIFREGNRIEEDPDRPPALYRAKMTIESESTNERDVVVKFTPRYNEKAHQILANAGLAPALHVCIPLLGGMHMVVMDYIDRQAPPKERRSDGAARRDVQKAIKLLHENDLVFGDLRIENIMRMPDGGAMLIDFDWVGKHQEDRYPASWNESEERAAAGVARRHIMDKAHDLILLESLRNL